MEAVNKVFWFKTGGMPGEKIGIALTTDEETGETKAFIGTSYSIDDMFDVEMLLKRGAELPQDKCTYVLNHLRSGKAKK